MASGIGLGLMAGANLLGANDSSSVSDQFSDSSNGFSGGGSSWSQYDAYSDWGGYSNYDAWSKADANSLNNAWSQVYGSEASAEDILRAKEANELQDAYMLAQMEYNAKQAQVQREWQEYMSNTSYQRAMLDLEKAGLNPILAAMNMGASTPMGAYASSGMQTAYKAQTYANSKSQSHGESQSHSASAATGRAENWGHSEAHGSSGSESSYSGGGSSHSEAHSESKADSVASRIGKTLGEAVAKLYEGGNGKSVYDNYNVPLVSN